MYLWQIFNEIVDNQDIYIYIGKKTTFEIFLEQKIHIFQFKRFYI